uniref:Si:dkey-78k11.9 n=1 Tax=Pundamilia nyererei TaxID=303518 RepID=A0A3B4H2A0_9CICH
CPGAGRPSVPLGTVVPYTPLPTGGGIVPTAIKDAMNNSCISFDFTGKFLPPVYILVFITGMVANGLGLRSVLQKWEKLGNVSVFVFNLGLADILYLLTLPFLMVYYFKGDQWIFGEAFCKTTRFFFNLNLYGSIGFLTCISVYRYLAIVHPMRMMGRITVTHSVAISVMVWLLVSVQSLPDMFVPKSPINNTKKCFDTTSEKYIEDYLKYSLGRTLTGFCIPLFITLSCYGHMIAVLCHNDNIDEVLKQRSLKLLFILILLFSVCYIPYHILKNLNLLSRLSVIKGTCHKCRGLVCLNSALNPLVYLHVSEDVCSQLRQLLQQARQAVTSLYTSNQTSVTDT